MLAQEYEGPKQKLQGTGDLFPDLSGSHLSVLIL